MAALRTRAPRLLAAMGVLAALLTTVGCAAAHAAEESVSISDKVPLGEASLLPLLDDDEYLALLADFPIMRRSLTGAVPIPGLHGAYGLKSTADGADARAFDMVRSTHFTPQGLAMAGDLLYVSAYDHERSLNSAVFVFTADGAYVKTIALENKSHVGGLGYDPTSGVLWIGDRVDGHAVISGIAQSAIDAYDIRSRVPIEYVATYYVDSLEKVSTLEFSGDALWASSFTNDPEKSQIQVFSLTFSEPDADGERHLTGLGDLARAYTTEDGRQHVFADLAFTAPAEVQGMAFTSAR